MFCGNCGAKLPNSALFCPNCGCKRLMDTALKQQKSFQPSAPQFSPNSSLERSVMPPHVIHPTQYNAASKTKTIHSKKKLEDKAIDLTYSAKAYADMANKTRYFSTFMEYYDKILDCLKEGAEIEQRVKTFKHLHGSLSYEYSKAQYQMQWHMRDALEREYDEILEEAKGKYRNNIGVVHARCRSLKRSIDENAFRFDNETSAFSQNILKKLSITLDISLLDGNLYLAPTTQRNIGYVFDSMEGLEFECWCAKLLRQTGYNNVEVTQGSGDQGVDIIAEKDDIRYAIQCKCYSSNLGNGPVQEVCAGKAMYNCQIGVVMTNRYFTKSAQELAKANGTLLWDRDRIIYMLNHSNQTYS